MRLTFLMLLFVLLLGIGCQNQQQTPPDIEPTTEILIDSLTGLVMAENFELVRGQCTSCHSAQLITQNRASREGWEQMIRWMQKDQGLWDLGETEDPILEYLSAHYGPTKKGRRSPLSNIEWYNLKE